MDKVPNGDAIVWDHVISVALSQVCARCRSLRWRSLSFLR